MRWRVEPSARIEIREAVEHYDAAQAGLGAEFLDEFEAGLQQIVALPHAWHPLGHGIRRYRLRRFAYGIIYQVREDEIVIYAVAHLHRRPDYWRER